MNRQKDIIDGKYGQLLSNQLDSKVRSNSRGVGAAQEGIGS